jgi:hypothetical protein
LTASLRTFEVHNSEDRNRTDRHRGKHILNPDLKRRQPRSNLIEQLRGLIVMRASSRWIVGRTLLVCGLAGTFVYAKSTEAQQQAPKRSRDNITVLTLGSHGVGPFYSGEKSYGFPGHAENRLFDIFCSAVDTEWFRPGQNSSAPALQRLRGPGSKPAMPAGRRYQLRPC